MPRVREAVLADDIAVRAVDNHDVVVAVLEAVLGNPVEGAANDLEAAGRPFGQGAPERHVLNRIFTRVLEAAPAERIFDRQAVDDDVRASDQLNAPAPQFSRA